MFPDAKPRRTLRSRGNKAHCFLLYSPPTQHHSLFRNLQLYSVLFLPSLPTRQDGMENSIQVNTYFMMDGRWNPEHGTFRNIPEHGIIIIIMLKIIKTELQTFINKFLRKILNIRWPEVISNEEQRGRTHQSRIEENIKRRKWKWIGRTLWKPVNNFTFSALEWNPQGFRRRGCQKQSWGRSVQAELAKNITRTEVKRTAKNRVW